MTRKSNIVIRALEFLRREGIVKSFWKALAYIRLELLFLPYALIKIKKFNSNSLDDLVDFCLYGIRGVIKPMQVRDEIMGLLTILDKIKPKVIIEIGTYAGGTLFLFCRVAAEDATIISIDFPDIRFGGGYPLWKIPLYKAFRLPKQKLYLVRADSHSQETLIKVKDLLKWKKADFVFIDGDHSYEGVKLDFEMYGPLVDKGGIVAFHDIVVHPAESGCEVSKLWKEIKSSKADYTEMIDNQSQDWGGIGLLFVNDGSFKK